VESSNQTESEKVTDIIIEEVNISENVSNDYSENFGIQKSENKSDEQELY